MLILKPNYKELSDRSATTFNELTGAYSPTNLGGWGTPNPETFDVATATLTIQKYGETTSNVVSLVGFPTDDSTVEQNIPYTAFGGTTNIPDGIYLITYECKDSGDNVVAFETEYVAMLGGIRCCIANLRKKLHFPNSSFCKCGKNLTEVSDLATLCDEVCDLLACDSVEEADKVIQYLKKFCSCTCSEC